MTIRTKGAILVGGAALLLIVAAIASRTLSTPAERSTHPVLAWDASPGATRYEVQIDGTLLGTYTDTQAELPAGFSPEGRTIQVRACNGPNCSPWQPLTAK